MLGLVVIEGMTLSGHLSNINEIKLKTPKPRTIYVCSSRARSKAEQHKKRFGAGDLTDILFKWPRFELLLAASLVLAMIVQQLP